MAVISLTPADLSIAALLIFILGLVSIGQQLQFSRQLYVAALRCTLQLLLMGLILQVLFSRGSLAAVLLMAAIMLLTAGQATASRQERPFKGRWPFFISLAAMAISSFSVTMVALTVIIDITPWYKPQYAIPLLGMLLGNTMNGVALSMDTLTSTVWQQRGIIEQQLMLGKTWPQAMNQLIKGAVRTGMTPILNAMATTGIVSLPGMMTGQILSGTPPIEAVKYQILIMFLITTGTGFGVLAVVRLSARHLFDERHRLRLDRLKVRG
ncbi:MAG: iron export ABC transporter permease subunit FetB [Thermodesulfobacteriota bacterium]